MMMVQQQYQYHIVQGISYQMVFLHFLLVYILQSFLLYLYVRQYRLYIVYYQFYYVCMCNSIHQYLSCCSNYNVPYFQLFLCILCCRPPIHQLCVGVCYYFSLCTVCIGGESVIYIRISASKNGSIHIKKIFSTMVGTQINNLKKYTNYSDTILVMCTKLFFSLINKK